MLPDIASQSHGRRFQNESVLRGYRNQLARQHRNNRSLASSMVFEDGNSKLLLRSDGRFAHQTRDQNGVRGTTEGVYDTSGDHVELRSQFRYERADAAHGGVETVRADERVIRAHLPEGEGSLTLGEQVLPLSRAEPALRKVQSNPELHRKRHGHPSGIPAAPGGHLPRIEAAQREKPNVSKWLDRLLAESRKIQRELAANRAAVTEMREHMHEEYRLAGLDGRPASALTEPPSPDKEPDPLRLTAEVEYHEQELS